MKRSWTTIANEHWILSTNIGLITSGTRSLPTVVSPDELFEYDIVNGEQFMTWKSTGKEGPVIVTLQ